MESLNINGTIYQFKVRYRFKGLRLVRKTLFYRGQEKIVGRRFILFGKTKVFIYPIHRFTLNFNILSPDYSREYLREFIDFGLKYEKRVQELRNGEII